MMQEPMQAFKPEIKLFLLVALIAVVVSVGGILLLKAIQAPVVQTPPLAPSPQPQTLDTSNWQTYHNDEYGFEIKYPLDFKSGDLSRGDKSAWAVEFYIVKDVSVSGPADPYIGPAINILSRSADFCEYCEGFDTEEVMVNGYYAVQSSRVNGVSLWVYSKDRQSVVRINYGFNSKEEKALMNQILSTFRFTP